MAGNADWENQPFDFLIDGELVRMSLEQFLHYQKLRNKRDNHNYVANKWKHRVLDASNTSN